MLRLNLSRIQLEKIDFDYHKKTHQRRQKIRHDGHSIIEPSAMSSKTHKRKKLSKISPSRSLRKKMSASPVKVLDLEQNQDSLISQDPVPRGSRAFWDKVLAEAGTPTRTQSTGSGNGRIFHPSAEWLETNRSIRASIGGVVDPKSDTEDDDTPNEYKRHREPTTHDVSSSDSFHSSYTLGYGMTGNNIDSSLESIRQPSSKIRLSRLFRRKAKPISNTETTQPRDSNDLGFDGHSSDMQRYHNRDQSTSTENSKGSALRDGLYGSQRDRRTISVSLDSRVMDDGIETPNTRSESIEPSQSSPPPVSLPLLIDPPRRPSSTLPRSPLYISQAAASSSPEKIQDVPSGVRSLPVAETPNLLSLPPRRRRTYRPRSETYSFTNSEMSSSAVAEVYAQASSPAELSTPHTMTSPSTPYLASISAGSPLTPSSIVHTVHRVPSTTFLTTSPSMSLLAPDVGIFSSRSSSRIDLPGHTFDPFHSGRTSGSSLHIRQPATAIRSPPRALVEFEVDRSASHGSHISNASSPSVSSHRNLSPHALPFIPRSARIRNLTPQYPLPPPFGANARTVSYSRAMPASTSFNAPLSASGANPKTPPPRQRSTIESTPLTPPRSTFTIYNDSQPPITQPQTPADFHRRLPLNPFHTAPARSRFSGWPPAATEDVGVGGRAYALPMRARGTPTRPRGRDSPVRMEGMVSSGGENVDAVTSEERERRRVWNAHIRIGRDEQRRLDGSPGLERSPGI